MDIATESECIQWMSVYSICKEVEEEEGRKMLTVFERLFTFICLSLLQKRYESVIAIKLVD